MNRKAFTLVELLIFLGMFAALSAAFITVLLTVTRVQVRQASVVEVGEQSQFLLQQIQYYIEKSSLIDIPQDTPTSTLKLWTGVNAQDPTSITLASGTVYLQQTATGTLQALSSNKVTVSNLTFTRRANAPSHDSVSISFTLAYNTSNIQQAFSQMLQTSVARVSAATFDSNIIPSSTAAYSLGTSALTWSSINQTIYFSGSNVGIGTTNNPVDTLELNGRLYFDPGSAPASTTNRLYNVSSTLYWNGTAVGGDSWTTTSTGIFYNGGNVGIGTTTSTTLLDVNGGLRLRQSGGGNGAASLIEMSNRTTGWTYGINFNAYYDGTWKYRNTDYAGSIGFDASGNFAISTMASGTAGSALVYSTKMTILNGGNVGIGTASPGSLVDIYSATDKGIGSSGLRVNRPGAQGQYAFVDYGVSSGDAYFGSVYTGGGAGTYGAIHLRQLDGGSNVRDALNIISNGNVGIGTPSPGATLHLYGTGGVAAHAGELILENTAGDHPKWGLTPGLIGITNAQFGIYDYTNSVYRMVISTATGNVGIGVTSPGSRLTVNGNIDASGGSITGGNVVATNIYPMQWSSAATFGTGTTVVMTSGYNLVLLTSSERTKDNIIRNWSPDNLLSFLALAPIQFDYKNGSAKGIVGFSAEEAYATGLPSLVNLDESGSPISLRDESFLAYQQLVLRNHETRIQELAASTSEQQQEINDLKNQLASVSFNLQGGIGTTGPGAALQVGSSAVPASWYNPSGFEAILTSAIQEQQGEINDLKSENATLQSQIKTLLAR